MIIGKMTAWERAKLKDEFRTALDVSRDLFERDNMPLSELNEIEWIFDQLFREK